LPRQQAAAADKPEAVTPSAAEPAAANKQAHRTDALLRSVDRIDEGLDDLDRRNRALQKELRSLRSEIAALRERETPSPKATNPADLGPRNPTRAGASLPQDRGRRGLTSAGRKPAMAGAGLTQSADDGQFILLAASKGDRVALYDRSTQRAKALRLPVATASSQQVTGIWGTGFLALRITGKAISQIAVFDLKHGRWSTQNLREPVELADPLVADSSAAYKLGRYVYAFSALTSRWDMLELPEHGVTASVAASGNTFSFRAGSHLWEFDGASGRWHVIDFDAILDAAPSDESEKNRTSGTP
jgi:hypothetical protein